MAGFLTLAKALNWDEYHKEPESSKKITAKDLEALFESGDRMLEKKKAVEELIEQTRLGKTACYEALKLDGKFAPHLSKQGDCLCWLKDGVEQIPLSVSAVAKGCGRNGKKRINIYYYFSLLAPTPLVHFPFRLSP